MNNQEAYDRSALHLLRQQRRSINTKPRPGLSAQCMYRGPDGLKCAVGCLIEDSEYRYAMEYQTACSLVVNKMLPASLSAVDPELLDDLQAVHDSEDPKDWPSFLLMVGKRHSLDTTAVQDYIDMWGWNVQGHA